MDLWFSQAVEDRSQHMNRASALSRLRTLIALKGNFVIFQKVMHVCWVDSYTLTNFATGHRDFKVLAAGHGTK
jgi:hypothetical protein